MTKPTELTYAIGDVHGCKTALDELIVLCLRDARERGLTRHPRFVFIGDYVDRGPDSAGVIRSVRHMQSLHRDRVVCLLGNHDHMLVRAVVHRSIPAQEFCVIYGGLETLRSYGVNLSDGSISFISDDLDVTDELRRHKSFMDDLRWLQSLPTHWDDDHDRRFVHAGVDPQRSFDDQRVEDLLWIRDPFLKYPAMLERYVVHGHSPTSGLVDARENRCNVDTACVYGKRLSAAVFASPGPVKPVGVLQVNPNGLRITS